MKTKRNTPIVRPYSKDELVEAYCGDIFTPLTGMKWLQKELESYPGLMDTLVKLGYKKRQRVFTRMQVKAIFDAFGAP